MGTTASGLDYPAHGLAPASTLSHFFDRWIFVLMAVWLIAITLTGFIRTSLEKLAAVETGMRPPFPFMLLQIQVGILFAIYIGIALHLRKSDPGMHKRLIFLAVALPLPAAFDRIVWLPHTMWETPHSQIAVFALRDSKIVEERFFRE